MASRHMNYLRKNAKPVLVVMGIVCMITFVVGTALLDFANNARQAASERERNPVVVTWTKGQVRSSEIDALRYRHQLAYDFLIRVVATAIQRGGSPRINGRVVNLNQQFVDVGIPIDNSDESTMQTMVLAEEANRMGIVVGPDAVKAFLKQISSPELQDGDWVEIANEILEREKASLAASQLFEYLGYELKAQHVRNLALTGLYAHGVGPIVPPGEAYDLFNRINRRFNIEAFPIQVAEFTKDVKGEPPAGEIQKLFDEGKFRDPNPNLDEPGFHKPHKLAFGYVKVNFAPFLEEAKKQITEEQVEEAYKKDIEQGRHKVQELPAAEPPKTEKTDESKEGEKKEAEKADANQPSADKPAEKEQKAASEEKEKAATEKPSTENSGCEAEQEATGQKAAEPAEQKLGEQKPAEATTEAKPADQKDEAKTPEAPPAKEPKFKPLSEVREEVLRQLANPIAEEARKKATGEIVAAVEKYGKTYRRYLDAKNIGKTADLKDPEKLDLLPLVTKYNFPIGETPLVDQFEVSQYEIGKNVQQLDFEALQQRRQIRMLSFADIAFSHENPLYKPDEVRGSEPETNYTFWRTAEEKAADVTLKDARPQVVEFWKKRQAFELAKAEAQKLAEKAKGASLLEVVPDSTKVILPPAFSWMTPGQFGMGGPELSQVKDIELAGQDFMQAVFALKPGESGVAPNQAKSIAYVVRVISQEPEDERLKSQFLESGYNNIVLSMAHQETLLTSVEWYRGVAKEYQVKWQRPPDDRRRM